VGGGSGSQNFLRPRGVKYLNTGLIILMYTHKHILCYIKYNFAIDVLEGFNDILQFNMVNEMEYFYNLII
jgi:hypothetical protein